MPPKIQPAKSEDSLLVGWAEIERYVRRSKRQLLKYLRTDGFPVVKLGRNVTTSRQLIDTWLLTHKMLALGDSYGVPKNSGPPGDGDPTKVPSKSTPEWRPQSRRRPI